MNIPQFDQDLAMMSQLIKTIIDDTGTDEEIPLPNVKSDTLKKIKEYCELHRNNPPPEIEKPLKSNNLQEVVDPNDAKFIDIPEFEKLFDLILAANYLDIKSLLDLACAKVASFIKGKFVFEFQTNKKENPQKKLERHLISRMIQLPKKNSKSGKKINGQKKLIDPFKQNQYIINYNAIIDFIKSREILI